MATENQTRPKEKSDAPVAAKPTPDKSLHDPVQSMHELLSLVSKTGTEAVASLQNLATEALYGKPANSVTAGGGAEFKLAAEAGKPQEAGKAHETAKSEGTSPSDGSKSTDATRPSDATKLTDAANQKEIAKEHNQLSDWADHNLKEPKLSEFKKNMESFEARAKSDKLDADEVIKTYKQVERLNAASGDKPLSETQRHNLSGEIMRQAADPTAIDQGNHATCSAATVEARTYTRTPSAAARVVTDVALTGEYRAPDGTHVRIDPHPHDESKSGTNIDGQRSHASEIFEVTAINLHYAKENAKNGTNIRYEQVTPVKGDPGDTGERLIDYSKKPPEQLQIDGVKVVPPHVPDNAITEMSNIITGKNEKDVQIEQAGNSIEGDTKGMIIVNSEAELKQQLKDAKENNRFPMVVKVSTFNEPFNSDAFGAGAGGEAGFHVVTITDYDEKNGNVSIDNQWGKKNDHGKDDPLRTHDLYIAMQKPQDAEKTIAADVKYNREHGISDPIKEIELKRYEANLGGDESIGRTSINVSIDEMKKRWDKGGVSDAEKSKERHALNNLIAAMPMADQATLIQAEHKAGISSNGQYENQVAILGIRMLTPTDNDPVTDMAKFDYKAALAALTPAQQADVLGKIDQGKRVLKHPQLEPAFEKDFMEWVKDNEGR